MALFRRAKNTRGRPRIEPRLVPGRRAPAQAGRRPVPRRRRRRSLMGGFLSLASKGAFAGLIVAVIGFGYIWMSLDRQGLLRIPDREPGIMLLAADGSVLAQQGSFYGDEVRINELPDYVPNALIAIEDRRFRSHFGIDPIGLFRAMIANARAGRIVQGGSTLTQQLAKNLFLQPDRTIERKLQEMVLAIWLERQFSKDEILQLYLNRVYYGAGAIGIEKAAQAYYRKPAQDLTLSEAATLAGVLKAPSNYNPQANAEAANARARLVIEAMIEEGFVTRADAQAAADQPASAKANDYQPSTNYIVDWVSEQLPSLVKNYDQSIIVQTTIDPHLQVVAERSLRKHLNDEGAKLNTSQGAVVMMDIDGAIKAMVGGKSYKRSQFNRVTKAKRQPGSAFKPFVYLAAIEQGFTPDSVEVDEPVQIGNWQPENYKEKYLGAVPLRTAFALSLNTIAAKLVSYVGPEAVAATAHRLGITSQLGNDASIALGTSEVTPLELTAAFVPFANGGYPVLPYAVTRISTKEGKVLYERQGSGLGLAISSFDLGAMNDLMSAVVARGTARKAQFGSFEVGGKTGTSQDYRDAWFVGFTSYLVTGVWLGNDDNSPTKRVTGGSLPAIVFKDVMEEAHAAVPPLPLPGERNRPSQSGTLAELAPPGEVIEEVPPPVFKMPLSSLEKGEKRVKGMFNSIEDLLKGERDRPKKQKKKDKKKKTLLDYL
jgi:penicillin-binding protein 1A